MPNPFPTELRERAEGVGEAEDHAGRIHEVDAAVGQQPESAARTRQEEIEFARHEFRVGRQTLTRDNFRGVNFGQQVVRPNPERAARFDRERAIFPETVLAFIRETQSKEWAKLEALQGRGELVPAGEVKREAFALARGVRDALLGIADRLAPQLAATQDARVCHHLLSEEIRVALRGLTDG